METITHPAPPTATAGIPFDPIKALSVSAGIPNAPHPIKALRVSAGIATAPAYFARGRDFSTCRLTACRSAFTLVELLVVIGIIATLAALVTPAVMRAQSAARNAAIKAEIDMLHMAIMNYKNEYGSFPPALDATSSASGLINRHILRLFPRTSKENPDNRASAVEVAAFFDNDIADRNTTRETRALVPWLMGFTDDPSNPIGHGGIPRNKLFDFDQSRISSLIENRSDLTVTSKTYFPPGKKNSPYVYIPGHQYLSLYYESPSNNYDFLKKYGAQYMPPNPLPSKPSASTPDSWHFTNTTGNLSFFNNDTFQILCAGRDEEFGTDDDLSNFWPGTRRDYLDSLRD